ncbi:MAG: tetratricopeptide repeat protein [Candidatus Eisenbacteria bacterium]
MRGLLPAVACICFWSGAGASALPELPALPVPPGPPAGPPSEITHLDIRRNAESLELSIPFAGAWTHRRVSDPPSLVIELDNARSLVPDASGALSLRLLQGPLESLEVRQLADAAGIPRVRLTLLLGEPCEYDAAQGQDEVHVCMAAPADLRAESPEWSHTISSGDTPPAWLPIDAWLAAADAELRSAPKETAAPAAENQPALGLEMPAAPVQEATVPAAAPALSESEESVFRELLADTTIFALGETPVNRAWEQAASRLVLDAQTKLLAGDAAAARDKLTAAQDRYPDVDATLQGMLLHRLLAPLAGDSTATFDIPQAIEGPWPLLRQAALAWVFSEAYRQTRLDVAFQTLSVWREAAPDSDLWVPAALHASELALGTGEADAALAWLERAFARRPTLRREPHALLLAAGAWTAKREWDQADSLLAWVTGCDEPALAWRARSRRADLRFRRGDHEDARQHYLALIGEEVPRVEREWARYQVGNCLVTQGRFESARVWLEQVASDPHGFWADHARMRLATLKGMADGSAWD